MKNALNGIRFTHQLLEGTAISDDQKQVLETSDACERQIMAIIDNIDIMNIEEGMTRPGQGRPSALIIDMFDGGKRWTIQEGLRLNLSRKLLNRMNGRVNC
ncbi:hypothetical protein CRG98_047377 [Punica granatum]|uniref:Signal transduction histidine kinase dimerisation/phosphoacceptor domain-containing protein n=1 Tax=Punica granatum TaxID=22663 RepID=A0A2I0HL82_PUNGR|nr:hypothetical protein CRG98_047377 [Punica granatum]